MTGSQADFLAERFEENRKHLRAVAYRMLGSLNEAEDAVQEAWIRFSRSDTSAVENLGGWLTTVVARLCLDMLRSRKSRREEELGPHLPEPIESPEDEALLADSVGLALLVVLETLSPAERVAFVLHDMFDLPFDEIGRNVGRSETAARQLASRARRRVRGAASVKEVQEGQDADRARKREVVDAFLAASREGRFEALLAVLAPDVVLRADAAAVAFGSVREVRGASAVAETFSGRARFAQLALVNGVVGAVWAPGGWPRVVFRFTIARGKIVEIEILADPARLGELEVVVLGG